MKIFKKIIVYLFIVILILSQPIQNFVYAQELPAAPIVTSPFTDTAFLDPDQDPNIIRQQAMVDSAITSLTTQPALNTINNLRQKVIKIRTFKKKTFKSNDSIPLTVDNEQAGKVKVEVFNVDGEKVDVGVEQITTGQVATMLIKPPTHFKPGRYHLTVTDSQGAVSTQDFTWGVLAINTNKSIYQQQDLAKLQMAVLDEAGKMVCDAKVSLSIKAPDGSIKDYTTTNNSIKVNPDCYQKRYTPVPDFEADYQVAGGEGTYALSLTAETKNGSYAITDSFQAKEEVPFDVERNANTRIYPPVTYPVTFSITANQDFNGEISEVVPESFKILPMDSMPDFHIMTRGTTQPAKKHDGHLGLPFTGSFEMTQGFGVEETDPLMSAKYQKYGLAGHDGLDYALPFGTPVLAVDDGVIVQAQEEGDYGTTVIIQHSWGKSYYGHLSKLEKVSGDSISKGDTLGLSGSTGLSTGPHLHFGIKLNNNDVNNGYYGKVNPVSYFDDGQEQVAGIATSSAILRRDTENGTQILAWDVNVKKGDQIQLGYNYRAPLESPQFYTVGPLAFYERSQPLVQTDSNTATKSASVIQSQTSASNSAEQKSNGAMKQSNNGTLVFKETRKWQIAADDMGTAVRTGPTIADYNETAWNSSGTCSPTCTKSTGSISWQAGDKIIVMALTADAAVTLNDPTATGLAFTPDTAQTTGSNCWGNSWTAQPTAAGSSTVTNTINLGNDHWGMGVWVFRDTDGIGNRAAGSGAPQTISLTRAKNNSAVVEIICDWTAKPVVPFSPAVSNTREASVDAGKYTAFAADWANEGAAGATSYGLNGTSTGTAFMKIAYEIYGCDSQPSLAQVMRHGKWFASCGVRKPFFF